MNTTQLIKELKFQFTRSGGVGGQHVNKVSTKVVLKFNVQESKALSAEEKEMLSENLANKISKKGAIILTSDASRSQHKNKDLVIKRFLELLRVALTPKKKRKPTKRPKSANLKRLEKKKNRAEKKASRQKYRF